MSYDVSEQLLVEVEMKRTKERLSWILVGTVTYSTVVYGPFLARKDPRWLRPLRYRTVR
jgi:hypothetical protein